MNYYIKIFLADGEKEFIGPLTEENVWDFIKKNPKAAIDIIDENDQDVSRKFGK